MAQKVGTRVNDKYEILKVIDTGGMSTVYIAMDLNLNKNWAIKEIIKSKSKTGNIEYRSLITETNILKELDHVYLPRIVDIIEDDKRIFVVMDYIEGKTLHDIVSAEGGLPQDKVVRWMKQLTQVLGYLHSRNPPIIYRDMKPSNIMLQPNGSIKLFDFGASRVYEGKDSWKTEPLGTMGYAAPERFKKEGGKFDARSDIHEMGMTFYHLITGIDPSKTSMLKPITEVDDTLNKGLEKIIDKMTKRNPDERYQSASELLYDLETFTELDPEYKIKLTKRLKTVVTTGVASLVFLTMGVVGVYGNTATTNAEFNQTLAHAEEGQDPSLAVEATHIKRDDIAPYLLMMDIFRRDGDFSFVEEVELTSSINSNKGELEKSDEYGQLAYKVAELTFYWGSDIEDKETKAIQWLDRSIDSEDSNADAVTLKNFIQYGKLLSRDNVDKSTYGSYWTSLVELLNNKDNTLVYLKNVNYAYDFLLNNSDSLVSQGYKKKEVLGVLAKTNKAIDEISISDDVQRTLKNKLTEGYKEVVSEVDSSFAE